MTSTLINPNPIPYQSLGWSSGTDARSQRTVLNPTYVRQSKWPPDCNPNRNPNRNPDPDSNPHPTANPNHSRNPPDLNPNLRTTEHPTLT